MFINQSINGLLIATYVQ